LPAKGEPKAFSLCSYIPLPPLAEQYRIVAEVNELMAICDRLESQLTAAQDEGRRLREAVLHKAVAPTIDPRSPDPD